MRTPSPHRVSRLRRGRPSGLGLRLPGARRPGRARAARRPRRTARHRPQASRRQRPRIHARANPRRLRPRRLVPRRPSEDARDRRQRPPARHPRLRPLSLAQRQGPSRKRPRLRLPRPVFPPADARLPKRRSQERRAAQGQHQHHDRHREGDDRRGAQGVRRIFLVDALDPWIRVVETDTVPKTRIAAGSSSRSKARKRSRSAAASSRSPENTETQRDLPQPALRLPGVRAAGQHQEGGGARGVERSKTVACASATAPTSRASAPSPASPAARPATSCARCTTCRPAREGPVDRRS